MTPAEWLEDTFDRYGFVPGAYSVMVSRPMYQVLHNPPDTSYDQAAQYPEPFDQWDLDTLRKLENGSEPTK